MRVPSLIGAAWMWCAVIVCVNTVIAPALQAQPAISPNATLQAASPGTLPVPPLPTPAQPGARGAQADVAESFLPQDMTLVSMFMSADVIVKAVMTGLLLASLATWVILLAKSLELRQARKNLARAHHALVSAQTFGEAAAPASKASSQVALLIAAVEAEVERSAYGDGKGAKERMSARLERIGAGVGRRMLRATGILATVGATAPFIGLFGTVWGIMNSFIGISKLHTTNLAVVAPGIAEALLATACGLAAAIPAVVIYNGFARSIADFRASFADASVELLTLVSRDLDRSRSDPAHDRGEARATERESKAPVYASVP